MIKRRLAFVVTNSISVNAFLINHIKILNRDFYIDIITNEVNKIKFKSKCKKIELKFSRKVNFVGDIISLFQLLKIMKNNKYDIVISLTPKSGLLTSICAKLLNIKIRIHYFTGQIWANKANFSRFFFKNIDKLISFLSTNILIDSFSQKEFLIANSIVNSDKSKVLGFGSISGVDTKKFDINFNHYKTIRQKYKIDHKEFVISFIGRLNKDKGVLELIKSINELIIKYKDITLLLIGDIESDIKNELIKSINNNKIKLLSHTNFPEKYFNASNIICLPSYREGFGNVVIEAASCGIPSIVSDIYGLKDSVIDNETGFIFNLKKTNSLKDKILYCYKNKEKISKLKQNCRNFVLKKFKHDYVSNNLLNYIKNL